LYERLRESAEAGELVERDGWGSAGLPSEFAADFEKGMRSVMNGGHGTRVWPLMRDLARFFWGLEIQQENTFLTFHEALLRIEEVDICYSTLNYDLLLEGALGAAGQSLQYGRDESDPSTPIYKLHGSINWVPEGTAQFGTASCTPISVGGMRVVRNRAAFDEACQQNECGAIMAMYEPDKTVLPEPRIVKRHQDAWNSEVRDADCVVCIGVRPVASDLHVWGPIRDARGHKLAVDPGAADEYERLGGPSRFTVIRAGFSESIADLVRHIAAS